MALSTAFQGPRDETLVFVFLATILVLLFMIQGPREETLLLKVFLFLAILVLLFMMVTLFVEVCRLVKLVKKHRERRYICKKDEMPLLEENEMPLLEEDEMPPLEEVEEDEMPPLEEDEMPPLEEDEEDEMPLLEEDEMPPLEEVEEDEEDEMPPLEEDEMLVKIPREKDEVQIPTYNKKEAMDRVNAVLQRKLEEVESGIGRLLEHPLSTYIHDDDDEEKKVSLYRTARKIDFIKNLLMAEMNSHSPHRPENLNRLATRLSILQNRFLKWDETFANGVESADNNIGETSASGSCTKSCIVEEEFEEESNINIRDRKQKETWEGTVEVLNKDEKEGREKKVAEMVSQREAKMVRERKVVAKKDVQERDGNRKEKTVGEVKVKTEEKAGESTRREWNLEEELVGFQKAWESTRRRGWNLEAELVGFQKAEVYWDDKGRKRKQQCRVRSCMAMGCARTAGLIAGFIAGFTSAMILMALANILYTKEILMALADILYTKETVYLVPT